MPRSIHCSGARAPVHTHTHTPVAVDVAVDVAPGRRRREARALSIVAGGLAALAVTVALPPGEARAEAATTPEFGRRGQVVLPQLVGVRTGVPSQLGSGLAGFNGPATIANIGWGGALGYSKNTSTMSPGTWTAPDSTVLTTESFWLAPAADVFVARRLSLGLGVGVLYSMTLLDGGAGTPPVYASEGFSVAVGPRVGYVVPLGQGLSFWPRLGMGLSWSAQAEGSATVPSLQVWTGRALSGNLDLALVYHPHERLMFQVAPQIAAGHSSGGGPVATEATWLRIGGEATAGLIF